MLVDGERDIGGREVLGVEKVRVGIDHDLANFAAIGKRDRSAFYA